MGDTSTDRRNPTFQRRLDALLALWEDATERGEQPTALELCPDDVELAAELQHAIDRLRRFQEFAADERSDQTVVPTHIGPYRVIRELARGGSSRVFLCEQQLPGREVAVKLLNHETVVSKRLHRFRLELQLLSTLSHPGIAQIYDAGTLEDDVPYFAMEYIQGRRLDDYLRQTELGVEGKLQLFVCIAKAVDFAHQQHIVHCDLKPANIMVTNDGQPKIIDFGIAKLTATESDAHSGRSTTRLLAGTAPYMSPEQFHEDQCRIDGRSDVYSLGVVLYEALSGVLPYGVEDHAFVDVAHTVCHVPARALPRLEPEYDRSLDAVIQKTLTKDPNDRYQTMGEFAADLQRVLNHVPVLAKRMGPVGQLAMWARRNRRTAALACVVASLLLLSSIMSSSLALINVRQSRSLRSTLKDLQTEQTRAAELTTILQRRNRDLQSANQDLSHANAMLRRTSLNANLMRAAGYIRTDPVLAESLLVDESLCPLDLRGLSWQLLRNHTRRSVREIRVTGAAQADVFSTGLSHDGRILVTLTLQNIRWWSVEEGVQLHSVTEMVGSKSKFALDAGADRALLLREDGVVLLIDTADSSKVRLYDAAPGQASALAISPDGQWCAIGNVASQIYLGKIDASPLSMSSITLDESSVIAMTFDSSGKRLAVLTAHGTLAEIDVASRTVVARQRFPESPLTWAEISSDLKYVCAGSARQYRVWDREHESLVAADSGPRNVAMPMNPAASLIVANRTSVKSRTMDGTEAVLHIREAAVQSIGLSADNRRLAVGGSDGNVMVYELYPEASTKSLPSFSGSTLHVRYSPDGTRLAVIGNDAGAQRELHVHRTKDGTLLTDFGKSRVRGRDVAFSIDGERLFTTDESDTVHVWNVPAGKLEREIKHPGTSIRSMAVSPDGMRLYVADFNSSEILVLSLPEGDCLSRMPCPAPHFRDLLLTVDGRQLFSVHNDGTIFNWDTKTFAIRWQSKLDQPQIRELVISPDNSLLVTSSQRGSPRIWRIESDGLIHIATLQSLSSNILSLAFAVDGTVLASTDFSGNLLLWDTITWQPQAILPHSHERLRTLEFSRDGRQLAAAGAGSGVTVWDLPQHNTR